MKSTLILNDLTCIDHAYIDNRGDLIGGSFHATVIITGEVTDDESVVIDFSTVKSAIKGYIDNKYTGYDHKLWILADSKVEVSVHANALSVTTPSWKINTDQNSLRCIDCMYSKHHIAKHMAKYLEEMLEDGSGVTFKVAVELNTNIHALESGISTYMFRYAHGLKNSSSYGCQNIAHGHLSYIQLLDNDMYAAYTSDLNDAMNNIAKQLDNTYFVSESNVTYNSDGILGITYESCDRGVFSAVIDTNAVKVVILPVETTVEYLSAYIKDLCSDLPEAVKYLVVSEGLSKGSIIER